MEGVLMWKLCVVSTKFYNTLAGTYRVVIDGKDKQFTLETSARRLMLFYTSFIPLCFTLIGSTLRAVNPPLPKENSTQVLIISFGEAAIIIAGISLNIVLILSGDSLVDLMNHSYELLKDTSRNDNSRNETSSFLFVYIRGESK